MTEPAGAPALAEPSLLAKLWLALGMGGRIALGVVLGLALLSLVAWGLRRLGQRGRRSLLTGVTVLNLVGLVVFGSWSLRLPELRGSYFVMWHQLVRGGAALCFTGFLLGFLTRALPWVLNRFEGSGFVPFVATRHVRASKSGFLTVISLLSIAGVGVSSFALCAVVSVMGGFGAELKRKILGNNAHIRVDTVQTGGIPAWRDPLDAVRLVPGVAGASPIAQGEAMASSQINTAGVIVRGVDTSSIGSVIDLLSNIDVGDFRWLDDEATLAALPPDTPIGIGSDGTLYRKLPELPKLKNDEKVSPEVAAVVAKDTLPGVVIGRELAKTMSLYVGDEVTLVSPMGDLGPMGILPRSRKFRVAAIFYSGMYEYDATHAYMKLEVAQEFLDLGGAITGIEVKVSDAERVEEVEPGVKAAVASLPELRVRTWKEMNRNLFSALKVEKIGSFIILGIAIAVASFCIICTLLLMVTEKSKEIAILKAIGASDHAILRVFMAEGIIIGLIGTVYGVSTGVSMAVGLKYFGVRLDPDVYYVDRLPISVDFGDYSLVALAAMVITTLATVYPALAASKLRPVEGIRWE